MSIKVKAVERLLKVGTHAGEYRYMLQAELYNKLSQNKVIQEAALRSGISKGSMSAAWDAIGEVIKAWATEGLGTMRFGVNAQSVADVNQVSSSLITTRKVIFTPSVDIKQELRNTAINITCYDRDGKVVKQVTSTDDGTIEENENGNTDPDNNGGGTDPTNNDPVNTDPDNGGGGGIG